MSFKEYLLSIGIEDRAAGSLADSCITNSQVAGLFNDLPPDVRLANLKAWNIDEKKLNDAEFANAPAFRNGGTFPGSASNGPFKWSDIYETTFLHRSTEDPRVEQNLSGLIKNNSELLLHNAQRAVAGELPSCGLQLSQNELGTLTCSLPAPKTGRERS